jgi:ribosomal protein L40E
MTRMEIAGERLRSTRVADRCNTRRAPGPEECRQRNDKTKHARLIHHRTRDCDGRTAAPQGERPAWIAGRFVT